MKKLVMILTVFALVAACSDSSDDQVQGITPTTPTNSEWSIPISEVLDGGPGRDGIPALVNPNFITAAQVTTELRNEDLVVVFKNGNDVRAYPHTILDWHEIINDNIGDLSVAITFCPLTGTGIGWDRTINGRETTFGVSGLLFNTNLIPFDRLTDSNWSQILNESVNGSLIGNKIVLYQLLETNWATAKAMYPDIKVVSTDTGFSRTYGTSPYGDYNTNNDRFLFPVDKDNRLPLKEKVMTLLDDGDAKVYRFENFLNENIIKDAFKGKEYMIVGNTDFMFSYLLDGDLNTLEFTYVFGANADEPSILLEDDEGNKWDVFGEAISGPRQGQKISASSAMMGQWFSIPAFYNTDIYGN